MPIDSAKTKEEGRDKEINKERRRIRRGCRKELIYEDKRVKR